ncbi:hypothetical protein C0J52_16093 [Blattella germanica]|nr:hypothetical protein C0J52_16093 [Blattella germanica]
MLNEEKCVQIKFTGIIISKFLKPILDNQAKALTNNNDFPKRLNIRPLIRKIFKIQIGIIIIPRTNFTERRGMRILGVDSVD